MKKVLSLFLIFSMLMTAVGTIGTITVSAANTVSVSTESALKNEIDSAPTDGTEKVITLTADIEATATITIKGGRNIVLKGNYTIKKKVNNENAFIQLYEASKLTIEDVTIDMNAAALDKGGRAIGIEGGSKATLKGSATIKDGQTKNDDSVIYLNNGKSIFQMEDDSKITGFTPKSGATETSIVTYYFGGQFIMNGGEISGNTIVDKAVTSNTTSGGIISVANDTPGLGNSVIAEFNGGKIVNNTWTGAKNNFVFEQGIPNNSEKRGVWYRGTKIKGVLRPATGGNDVVHIGAPIDGKLGIYRPVNADGSTDADLDGIADYYSNVVAEGVDSYTLDAEDMANLYFYDPTGNDNYILCLKSADSKIYVMDGDADVRTGYIAQEVTRYTVSFVNGDGSLMKKQMVREGKAATPPTEKPVKKSTLEHSYVFNGWEDYSNITSDCTIEPKWTEIDPLPRYTVKFYNGDGTVMSTQSIEKGDDATVPDDAVKTEEGKFFRFEGWDTDSNGKVDTGYTNIQENLNIYPIFTEAFRVRFYDRWGYVIAEQFIAEGENATAPANPSLSGCRFEGWSEDYTNVTSNLDIYPNFVEIFTVTFKGIGGVTAKTETVDIHKAATPPTDDAMKVPNHTFMGWEDANGNPVTDFSDITANLTVTAVYTYAGGFESTVSSEVTLMDAIDYAPRTGAEYVITISNDIDISRANSITITAGQNIVLKGDITLKKTGSHTNAFIKVEENAKLTLEDVDIDLNASKLDKTGAAIEGNGAAILKGNSVIKNGLIANNAGAVNVKNFTMSGNSKITGFNHALNIQRCSVIKPNSGGTIILKDNAEISGNVVIGGAGTSGNNGGIISSTDQDAQARHCHVEIRDNSKIINNIIKGGVGYAVFMDNDSGAIEPKISGSAEIQGTVFCDNNAHILSELKYPLTLRIGLTADGTRDADEDGRIDYYSTRMAIGASAATIGGDATEAYALTEADLQMVSYYDDEYLPCLYTSGAPYISVMDADATVKSQYIAKNITKYDVNFYNGDGSIIATLQIREKGRAKAPEEIPTKAADGVKVYRFSGWDKELTNIPAGGLEVYPLFNEFVVAGADKVEVEMNITSTTLTVNAENAGDGAKCVLIATDSKGNETTEILTGTVSAGEVVFTKTGIDSGLTYKAFIINEENAPVSETYTYKNGNTVAENPSAVVGGNKKVTDVSYSVDALTKTITVSGTYQAKTTLFLKVSLNGVEKLYSGANCDADGAFSFKFSYAGDYSGLTADDRYAIEFCDLLSAVAIESGATEIDPVTDAEYNAIMEEINALADGAALVEYEKTNADTLKLLGIDTAQGVTPTSGYALLNPANKLVVMDMLLSLLKSSSQTSAEDFNSAVKTKLEAQAVSEVGSAISSSLTGILTKYKDVIGISTTTWNKYQKNKNNWDAINKEFLKETYEKDTVADIRSSFAEALAEKTGSTGGGGGGGSSDGGERDDKKEQTGDIYLAPKEPTDVYKPIQPVTFSDVETTYWAYEPITILSTRGVINGMGDGNYAPEADVTREAFVKMLVEALGLKATGNALAFTDVAGNEWYSEYVNIASSIGLVTGYDGKFGIGEGLSREQMATMLYRAAEIAGIKLEDKVEGRTFTDSTEIGDYATEAVNELCKAGIINGMDDGSYSPKTICNRAMAAKVLYEILVLK